MGGINDSGIVGGREFPSTVWSAIRHAQDPASPEYERHLQRLIELYWKPVYLVVRRSWAKSPDDAKDLAQEFFAHVVLDRELLRSYAPEAGSFRGLMRAALRSFLSNAARDGARKKRGGDVQVVPFDERLAEQLPAPEHQTPDELFDAAWNQAVLEQAVTRLEARLTSDGRASWWQVFRRYDLEDERREVSYAEVGQSLGLTVPQVKHALLTARALFRELVVDVVREYVDGPEDLDAELQTLFGGS